MSIVTDTFGGNGGSTFAVEGIKSLGLNGHKYIDALLLNGTQHGGNGGDRGEQFQFDDDEYITDIAIKHGQFVDSLEIQTNKGKTISGGGGGGQFTPLYNVRVLGIGGKSGQYLDQIVVKYIDNYTPSVQVEVSSAIINIVAPGGSIERFTSNTVATMVSQKNTMQQVFKATIGVETKALGEFIAKLNAGGEITSTRTEEITNTITQTMQTSEKTIFTAGPGRVGLEMVPVQVFVDTQTNFYWMWPVGPSTMVSSEANADRINTNAYDLTTFLGVQMPNLLPRRKERNGFIFYQMD